VCACVLALSLFCVWGLSLADIAEAPEQRELAQDRRGRAHHCLLCDDICFPCAAAKAGSVAARHLSRCGADAVSERVWAGLNGPGGAARSRSLARSDSSDSTVRRCCNSL
jgi:hypothetical protein